MPTAEQHLKNGMVDKERAITHERRATLQLLNQAWRALDSDDPSMCVASLEHALTAARRWKKEVCGG